MTRSRTIYDRQGKKAEFENDELVWVRPGALDDDGEAGPQVVRDIGAYRSMIDGSVIDGRKRHRDHLRAHRCAEIGNDTSHMTRKPMEASGPSRKETLHRMLGDVGDRDMKRIIQNELRNRR